MAHEIKNILVNYLHDRELKRMAPAYLHGRLLDIGCGEKPYAEMVKPYVTEHIGVDHQGTLHDKSNIDRVGTAYEIPAEDGEFDSAICTSVLEHLEEPEISLRECYRVLKRNGIAIYSMDFIWHVHEAPRDFFRFSKFGIKYLFEKVGFEIVELIALSGFWATFGQLFVYNLFRLNRGPLRWLRIIVILGLFIQLISYCFDRLDKTEQWTVGYMVVVRKR